MGILKSNTSFKKQCELIKLENEDLQNQLRELEIIQSTITNKDRLIEQTDLNTMNESLNVFVLNNIKYNL